MRRERAVVVDHAAANAAQPAIGLERHFQLPILVALLDGGEEVLAPILDPRHRSAGDEAGSGHRGILRIHDEFRPEPSTDVRRDDAQLVFVAAKQLHQHGAKLVAHLGRSPDGEQIGVRVKHGGHATAFDRMGAAAMLLDRHRGRVRRIAECAIDIAVGLPQ